MPASTCSSSVGLGGISTSTKADETSSEESIDVFVGKVAMLKHHSSGDDDDDNDAAPRAAAPAQPHSSGWRVINHKRKLSWDKDDGGDHDEHNGAEVGAVTTQPTAAEELRGRRGARRPARKQQKRTAKSKTTLGFKNPRNVTQTGDGVV
jgi:hypothetical protein